MVPGSSAGDRRALLDAKLTELVLFAKELCPAAAVEASALPYEDEDGRVEIFPPSGLSDAEALVDTSKPAKGGRLKTGQMSRRSSRGCCNAPREGRASRVWGSTKMAAPSEIGAL
jgi:hypothetical protein